MAKKLTPKEIKDIKKGKDLTNIVRK